MTNFKLKLLFKYISQNFFPRYCNKITPENKHYVLKNGPQRAGISRFFELSGRQRAQVKNNSGRAGPGLCRPVDKSDMIPYL